jgi:hypothetical protein
MGRSFKEWLEEGEELYSVALNEYHGLEAQLTEIKRQLAAKLTEVNQIAQVIDKPRLGEGETAAIAGGAGVSGVEVVEAGASNSTPYTRSSIARVLSGQPLRR